MVESKMKIIIVFLLVFFAGESISAEDSCTAARAQAIELSKLILGYRIPECNADGSYHEVQCDYWTGCWCVTKDGTKILGTKLEPGKGRPHCGGPCTAARHRALELSELIPGYRIPICNADGSFDEVQCDYWRGCWCVTKDGKEIQGSRIETGKSRPHCGDQTTTTVAPPSPTDQPTTTIAPPSPTDQPTTTLLPPSPTGSTQDEAVCLPSANAYRARHTETPPLEWDTTLAKNAKAYADVLMKKTLANNGVLSNEIWVHDPRNGEKGWGENLYWADGKKGSTEELCGGADKAWYAEIKNYNFLTGEKINGKVIGHFTQMVWKSSTKVGYGVAVAPSPNWGIYGLKMVFVVAKYKPGGNYHPYTANVMPLIVEGCSEHNCAKAENKVCEDGACVCASGFSKTSDGTCEKESCKKGDCECGPSGEDCEDKVIDYDSIDVGHCVSVSKEDCLKIAKQLNKAVKVIRNKDINRFPPGCYHKVTASPSLFYYNEQPSTRECDYRRKCICKPQGSS